MEVKLRNINLTGTSGKEYDLDKLSTEGTRDDSNSELIVQIWKWNPNAKDDHKYPNPPDPKLGQIWLSKLVDLSELE